ncbi:uncharacterized protein RAG0_07411 [Rhynchosporium agropyri]|uniref:Protein kinase domain-containing protein n=1 Tax=Rhynchosporium agropyri TaxID=914238 RepID=A0A1E1KLH1_9HELO|nr:uncharacterized protein RAG0_07411 [Rhynchosporium agropyri]
MISRHGEHLFFVMTPLGMSMRTLQDLNKGGIFAQSIVKGALDQILFGLNSLHEANVTHTDDLILAKVEEDEIRRPSARKQIGDTTIYVSRYMLGGAGPLIICDFGQARIGDKHHGNAMPVPYRAPEIWDFLEKEGLFTVYDKESEDLNDAHHHPNSSQGAKRQASIGILTGSGRGQYHYLMGEIYNLVSQIWKETTRMISLTYSPAFSAGCQRSGSLLGRLITIVGCGGDLMSQLQYPLLIIDI